MHFHTFNLQVEPRSMYYCMWLLLIKSENRENWCLNPQLNYPIVNRVRIVNEIRCPKRSFYFTDYKFGVKNKVRTIGCLSFLWTGYNYSYLVHPCVNTFYIWTNWGNEYSIWCVTLRFRQEGQVSVVTGLV